MESYKQLKDILCTEIDEAVNSIMRQGKISLNDLEVIDKLTHSLKSVVTTMAMEDGGYSYNGGYSEARRSNNMGRYADGGYSGRYYGRNSNEGYSSRGYSDGGYSGRRYSRDEGKSYMIQQFEKLMEDTSTQEEREVLQSAINRLKNM